MPGPTLPILPTDAAPRQRDADRSQAAILLTARDEFAEHGLGGARMEHIAERAALDKRLIDYYFKNKTSLFRAVLEDSYRHICQAEQQWRPRRAQNACRTSAP